MDGYFWLVILASAIWVLIDAKSIGVKKGLVSGIGNMGPWAWCIVTLLLWIVGFPMYIYYRGKFKHAIADIENQGKLGSSLSGHESTVQSTSSAIEDIEKLAALKEKGIISGEEFETKKKQLLGI